MVSRSLARRWWTISSDETVSAPRSPSSLTKVLLPEAKGPVTATVTGPALDRGCANSEAISPLDPGQRARRRHRYAGPRSRGCARGAARGRGADARYALRGEGAARRARRAL